MSANPKDANGRTVKPNGEVCKRMRIERGWDVAAMAVKTGLTRKTVESVEAGNRCFPFTLKAFSDTFGLPDLTPLLEEPRLLPSPIVDVDRVQLRIKLWLPFADCDFTQWLIGIVNKLIKLIDPMSEIEVVAVSPGSVIIILEMSAQDTRKAVSAFGSGELDEIEIASMMTDFGAGEIVEFNAIDRTPAVADPPPRPSPPSAPSPQGKPEKSLLGSMWVWLFGEGSKSSAPPPYKEKGATIFDRFKQKKT